MGWWMNSTPFCVDTFESKCTCVTLLLLLLRGVGGLYRVLFVIWFVAKASATAASSRSQVGPFGCHLLFLLEVLSWKASGRAMRAIECTGMARHGMAWLGKIQSTRWCDMWYARHDPSTARPSRHSTRVHGMAKYELGDDRWHVVRRT